ncbi:hypothetical protein GGD66_002444 [Bradyrhizobium sp. CIR48]|uniref:protein DpdJ n=1 Tax=Bradyrhizobium sp. CIR48 TaxID=2663840 RepID=UPI001606D574|nr:protein DpdJ [Bradyrhizobium sp. CIR48]MBB4423900.1 hypothetical protein [Bradyrhizobium sp. CIR48]
MTSDETIILAALDQIEQREARLLTWGLVDGFLASEEITDLIDPLLDDPRYVDGLSFVRASQVIDVLKARALLFDIGEAPDTRYRSRMAEAVRLFFRLRQLFPKHSGLIGWQNAPTLVADFRFIWRRRRYPKRAINASEALATISAVTSDGYARQAIASLIESYGVKFTLARFQVAAAARILGGFESSRSIATLVSAGTGSGKTLAFYLPALARIASHIQRDATTSRWVKVLALYPRNELLKDQFAEVYAQARRLDGSLVGRGLRKILIGTFFGATPYSAAIAHEAKGWRSHTDGIVCEYLRCPRDGCDGEMVWGEADRRVGTERLSCLECGRGIESDEIILTRSRLERESPDILFTTTEMLNQRMGDDRVRHLFGLGDLCRRPVEMMLLDEVHTYSGGSGAQVAFLLRRWRHLLGKPVSLVGLSATLTDGARFFGRLTGLNEHASIEIAPSAGDMIAEGAEYLIALRGDPVSRTALLSTTIQAAMLLSRILDAPDTLKSEGILGERLFLFADNIDVINRMYFAMLDAEGRRSTGAVDMRRHPNGGLAVLRRPMSSQQRKLHGQDWEVPVEIGHNLQPNDRKSVGRVMAMDPGVGNNLDIIVATASLEVGFNDPRVGGVIQHKAPVDVAQFLQRKGRAGRSRRMRPWTVAVLSDYGRDRIAYQGYDLLFDPQVPVRTLPIGNRYVERIQGVYVTLDYLSQMIGSGTRGSIWTNLVGAASAPNQRERQARLASIIRRLLIDASEQDRYATFISNALRLDRDEVQSLLWEHPRPLLTQVLPTALRRLETGWRANGQAGEDYQIRNSPLPEFAPANLFSDLNLPEVEIVLPGVGGVPPDPVTMPIGQAMREFAAGRVSRRFGLSHGRERHWLCPQPDQNRAQKFALDACLRADRLGDWLIQSFAGPQRIPVYRPRVVAVQLPPPNIVDTSNARLRWRTQIVARQSGLVLEPPQSGHWARYVADVRFHTHQGLSPIELRRMALVSEATINFQDGTALVKEFSFEIGEAPAALGFSLTVDALSIRLRFPQAMWSDLGDETNIRYRAMRTARFYDQALRGDYLEMVDSPFAREWLAHLLLASLSNEAIARSISLQAAAANLAGGTAELSLQQTLDILFQSAVVDDINAQANVQDRLRQDLAALLADPRVNAGLFDLAAILWTPIAADWEPWLRERFTATAGAAAFSAVLSLCPEIDGDALVVDIDAGPREQDDVFAAEPGAEVWISELAPGGNGHIEEALRQYAEDPRRFFNLMTAALRDNDFSLSDFQLQRYLETVVENDTNGGVSLAAQAFRSAYGADESYRAFSVLRQSLAEQGFATFHAFIVALANRVLRPGSSSESDAFVLDAIRQWNAQEQRLGVELDARVIAYRLARRGDIDAALAFAGIDAPTISPDQWRFGVIYGLLWPRGAQIRQSGLRLYSPYVDLPLPEPLLLRSYFEEGMYSIDVSEVDWKERCLERLADVGAVTLSCPMACSVLLADALSFIATNPVQANYLSVFARVQAVRRVADSLQVDLDVAETLQ